MTESPTTLDQLCDRIAVINLDSELERRQRFFSRIKASKLCKSRSVKRARAVDGHLVFAPDSWQGTHGAWGCLMSHTHVVQDAIMDDVETLCVFEDDAVFRPDALARFQAFMRDVPNDWQQLYLGGEHWQKPDMVSPSIVRGTGIGRTHAFILRRSVMRHFLSWVCDFRRYSGNLSHVDVQLSIAHKMGMWHTYAPAEWICGQAAGASTVRQTVNPEQWWQSRQNP